MPAGLATPERNRIADDIVSSDLTMRLHTGDPGANGTDNRIGTLVQTLTATHWSDASGGDVTYNAALDFGTVDNNNQQVIRWYSLWRGNTFIGAEEFASAITVAATGTFTIATGEVVVRVSTS